MTLGLNSQNRHVRKAPKAALRAGRREVAPLRRTRVNRFTSRRFRRGYPSIQGGVKKMNYAFNATHLTRPRSHGRSLLLLTANDADRLKAFYLSLDFDNRRSRFGGGQSDQSIVAYCRMIDWQRVIILARGSSHLLD